MVEGLCEENLYILFATFVLSLGEMFQSPGLYWKVILREDLVRTGAIQQKDRESGLLDFIHSSDRQFICCTTVANLFS